MKESLQDTLTWIPLHQISCLTSIPKEPIYYDFVLHQLPDEWVNRRFLCVLDHPDEWMKLNDQRASLQFIQDSNLVGIIFVSQTPVFIQEEICTLFEQFDLPIVQVNELEVSKLFQQGNGEFYSYWQVTKELDGFKEKGYHQIANQLAKMLNAPLLTLNQDFHVLFEAGKDNQLKEAKRWINMNHQELMEQDELKNSTEAHYLIIGNAPYFHRLQTQSKQILFISEQFVNWQKKFIDKFVGLISLYLQSEKEMSKLQEKLQEQFVYDLLYHKFESKKVLIKLGKTWDWNLEKPHHLLVIDVELCEDWDGEFNWVEEVLTTLEHEKKSGDAIFHVLMFDDQILLLVEEEHHTLRERKAHVEKLANTIEQTLSNKWENIIFKIGIGKCYQDTTELNKSYQEAKLALEFGQEWYKDRNVFHFSNLGVLRLLFHIHQGILTDFSEDYLALLIESDRKSGTEYLKTLQIYIQYHGKINEVSEALFVHPNTLRYRIKKIEEITGINLQNPEEFSNIMIAVQIFFFLNPSLTA
ncbi:helix-turn-helix domain-containing protein [Bacillus sp. B15-48]|uniref:PucR family transcriptional regulator n=1 Tax=Bacillus sp. B15-48 TaxID=1548601 RepID=UPI00193F2D49|nr:helix-turn-helix domain-containing protein [Bacillus sp. B15-48]